jgi:hypothetical protein
MLENRSGFSALRRLAQPRRAGAAAVERCELCRTPVPVRHRHLLEMATRQIVCACDGCALRFQIVVGGRFKLIPRNVQGLGDFAMSDNLWESFALPINLLFVYQDSRPSQTRAIYPSPAGGTESLLPQEAWTSLMADNSTLKEMESDVEALLLNRVGSAREYFIVPIDRCFALVGLIRTHWRGFSGGEAVWQEIDKYFEELRVEAGTASPQVREVSRA